MGTEPQVSREMQPEVGMTVADYVGAVRRRRLVVWGIVSPIVLIGVALAVGLPDVYRSAARFRLVSSGIDGVVQRRDELIDQYIRGLSDKVLSPEILRPVVREVNPYSDLEGQEDLAIAKLQSHVIVDMTRQTVLEPGGGRERTINTGFFVAVDHRSSEMAAELARRLTALFVEHGRADLLAAATNRVEFFTAETERLSKQISDLERQMADFKSANFGRLPETVQANVMTRGRAEQELEGVEREVRTLQQNRVFIAQQLRQAQAGPTAGNLQALEAEYAEKAAVYAETHPDMLALRRQIDLLRTGGGVVAESSLQAELEAQQAALVEARQRYSDDHPDVRRMIRNIESLQVRIASGETTLATTDTLATTQLRTQLNAINTQIAGLQSRAAQLRVRLAQLDTQLGATPEVERGFQSISRGLDTAREQFNQMINKKMDAEVEVAAINSGSVDRFALVASAGVPLEPAGPKRLGILVVSVVASLTLAFAAVVAAELFDSGVRGSRDVRNALGVTPLSVIPEIRNSVFRVRRKKRLMAFAGAVVLGIPTLFLAVRMVAA